MKYKVIHDMPGRIRVRSGNLAFNINQSYAIEHVLGQYEFVQNVKTSHTTGSILVQYDTNKKNEILSAISEIDVKNLPEIKETELLEMLVNEKNCYDEFIEGKEKDDFNYYEKLIYHKVMEEK